MLEISSEMAAEEPRELSSAWIPESGVPADPAKANSVDALARRFFKTLTFHI